MLMNRIVALVLIVTMSATAVGFTGLSVYLLLLPVVGAAASAALTAAIFVTSLALAFWIQQRKPVELARPLAAPANANPRPEAIVASLATIAKTYPLIAVACAAAMGLADTIVSRKK
jgi:hypothetical protein